LAKVGSPSFQQTAQQPGIVPQPAPVPVAPFPQAAPVAPPAPVTNAVQPPQPVWNPATGQWETQAPQAPAPIADPFQQQVQQSLQPQGFTTPPFAAPPVAPTQPSGFGIAGMPGMNGAAAPSGGLMGMLAGINLGAVPETGGGALLDLFDGQGNPIHYEGEVVKSTAGKTSAGAPKIELEVVVTFPTKYKGVKLYDNLTFGDTAMWKTKSMMRATGLLNEDGSIFLGTGEQDFVGNIVRFDVAHKEWEGVTRNKIAGGYTEGYETPGLANPAPAQQPGIPNFG
jgi:hypothetical protein